VTTHSNPCWRCDNMGGMGKHVTCNILFGFWSDPFFFFFTPGIIPSPHQWMILIDYISHMFTH